ncbi:MAG: type II secretion system minor pseudopilin GspI, partial [Hyphomonadaceae bacterium]|nr:type II secretion system minor pseudopilin GspI [Hyphomonadaceae bacterium]
MTKSPKKDRGFTLIEVLAALIVFSIAILGLSQAGSQSVRSVGVLENRMLAGIVADNVLV